MVFSTRLVFLATAGEYQKNRRIHVAPGNHAERQALEIAFQQKQQTQTDGTYVSKRIFECFRFCRRIISVSDERVVGEI